MQPSFQHEHQWSVGIARKMSFCTLSSFHAPCCHPTKLSLSITAAVKTVGCAWQVSGVLGAGRSLAECSRSSQLRLCWTSSTSLSDITLSGREKKRERERARKCECECAIEGVRLNQEVKEPYQSTNYLHWSLIPMEGINSSELLFLLLFLMMLCLWRFLAASIWPFMLVRNTQLS